MTPASPELRKLYLKVIRRVHPDGAIDEQDRLRCERLTQQANQAYGIRDEAALRAVLGPQARRLKWKSHASHPQWSGLRTKLLAIAGIAIAALSSYFISTLTSPMVAPAAGKQQQVAAERDATDAHATGLSTPQIPTGTPSRRSPSPRSNHSLDRRSQSPDAMNSNRYLATVKAEVEKNFELHSFDVPEGTHVDIGLVIRRDGQPETPYLMMPSGHIEVDSACLQSVEQINSFGETPIAQNMTVNIQCTVSRFNQASQSKK